MTGTPHDAATPAVLGTRVLGKAGARRPLARTSARVVLCAVQIVGHVVVLGGLLALVGCGGAPAAGESSRPVGNDAVLARLASQPALPVAASLEVRTLRDGDVEAVCRWQGRALGSETFQAECPDGSVVRLDDHCDRALVRSMREALASCPMTLGEWEACILARRDAPCSGGTFGEALPECEALALCIAQAIEADEAAQ